MIISKEVPITGRISFNDAPKYSPKKDKLIVLCPNMLEAQDTITSIVEDGAHAGTINRISIDLMNGTSFIFIPEGYAVSSSFEQFKEILNERQKERGDSDGI